MSFLPRTIHSLRTRGLTATLRSARRHLAEFASRLADRRFDRRLRTDTRGTVENVALTDAPADRRAHGIRYEPTRGRPLKRLLRAAGVPGSGTFVDIGCGKGRVLMLAAERGFPRVTGVDYSATLCNIARANLERVRIRTGLRFEATIHNLDAAAYAFQPGDRVVYLYNPFDAVVLRPVIDNLCASLRQHPRDLWLIYHRPEWRAVIEESEEFDAAGTWCFGGCEFAVYRARTTAPPPPPR